VPQNLRRVNNLLPKPCYPDARPHSPTAWTVAEQAHAHRKKAKAAAAAAAAAAANPSEGVPPPPAPADQVPDGVPQPPSQQENTDSKRSEHPSQKEKVPSAAALADYYIRRPLQPSNREAPQEQAPAVNPRRRGYADYRHIQSRYADYNRPSARAQGRERDLEPINKPRIPYSHGQYGGNPRVAGHPVRVQYQHRMW